jgi:hypothetical protein
MTRGAAISDGLVDRHHRRAATPVSWQKCSPPAIWGGVAGLSNSSIFEKNASMDATTGATFRVDIKELVTPQRSLLAVRSQASNTISARTRIAGA